MQMPLNASAARCSQSLPSQSCGTFQRVRKVAFRNGFLFFALGLLLLAGCTGTRPQADESPAALPQRDSVTSADSNRKILKVPFVRQLPDFCGEACIEMAMTHFGAPISQREVHRASGLTGLRGVHADELEETLTFLRIPHEKSYVRRKTGGNLQDHAADRDFLISSINAGHPVLLGVWADPQDKQNAATWDFDHFVLLVGYDKQSRIFYVHDPLAENPRVFSWEEFSAVRQNRRGAFYSLVLQGAAKKL